MPVTIAALGRQGPPRQDERRLRPLPLPGLRRNARHRQPAQQPRPLLHLQEKPHIDLLLTLDYDFLAAVTLLERCLQQYQARHASKKAPTAPQ